jgi:hypothetical protein
MERPDHATALLECGFANATHVAPIDAELVGLSRLVLEEYQVEQVARVSHQRAADLEVIPLLSAVGPVVQPPPLTEGQGKDLRGFHGG